MDNLDLRNKGFMLEQCAKKLDEIDKAELLDSVGFLSTVAFIIQLGAATHSFNLWRMGKMSDELALRLVDAFLDTFQSEVSAVLNFDINEV